jgi:hypothetical protein
VLRALLFRVRGIRKINSVEEAPATVTVYTVYIGDVRGEAPTELLVAAKEVGTKKGKKVPLCLKIASWGGFPAIPR